MSERIKKVFSNGEQVIHLWANQSQSDARSRNVFFEGDTVYSYGRHYILGKLHTVKGNRVAVINSKKYSVTTAKHQGWAWDSFQNGLRIFSSDLTIKTGVLETHKKLNTELDSFFRKRVFRFHGSTTEQIYYILKPIAEFNEFCSLLGYKKYIIKMDRALKNKMTDHITEAFKKEEERNQRLNSPEHRAKLEKARIKKYQKQLDSWKRGGPLVNVFRQLNSQLIRVREGVVETTRGAQVPLKSALELLSLINSGEKVEGHQIGSFTVNEVDRETIRIGCHTINLNHARKVLSSLVK